MQIGPKITIGKPKITLGDKERGLIAGTAMGPVGMALGYMYGEKLGNWSTNTWNGLTGKTARENAELEAKEMDRLRREGIIKEMGARQQADATTAAGFSKGANSSAVGQMPGGFIGSNLTTTAGTF